MQPEQTKEPKPLLLEFPPKEITPPDGEFTKLEDKRDYDYAFDAKDWI